MATDFERLDALYPLPPDQLPRQWLLARDADLVPDPWERRSLRGWTLGFHPDAHVCDLRSREGGLIGWLVEPLAYLSPHGGVVPESELVLPVASRASAAAVERALYGRDARGLSNGAGVEGLWVAILPGLDSGDGGGRVYLGAAHSVVYDPTRRVVATTHNLVPALERNELLSRAYDPLATFSFFTFGLTAFHTLKRLLPNHYLDLATFEPVRHWPPEALEQYTDGSEGAAAVIAHSRRLLATLSRSYRHYRVFLSAGRDSRAVLAILAPLIEERGLDVRLSTTVRPDMEARVDLQAARRLARIAELPHDIRRREPHTSEEDAVLRAFVRIGESKAGRILSAPGLARQNAPRDPRFVLAGMAGETARGYYWDRSDDSGIRRPPPLVTPELLVRRTGSPNLRPILQAADRWLQSVPPDVRASSATVLDLAYVEQRLGCWESSSRYLFPGRPRVTSPMAAAFNLQTMLRLPESYRGQGLLQRDIVEQGWPELMVVPFNQPTGVLRLRRALRRLARTVRSRIMPSHRA